MGVLALVDDLARTEVRIVDQVSQRIGGAHGDVVLERYGDPLLQGAGVEDLLDLAAWRELGAGEVDELGRVLLCQKVLAR